MDGDGRQREVESSLLRPIRPAGRPPARMSLRDRMQRFATPGVSIAVIRDGRVDWAAGYGVREAGRRDAVAAETRFHAASISKPVAAMTVLRLAEDGLLDLDADVNEKLTSWRVPENDHTTREKVTPRRILNHTAGLGVHGFPGYAPRVAVPTVPQALDGAGPANTDAVRVNTAPGAQWSYSGGGYTIAQQLVEDVTGDAFRDVARTLVLAPLGMTHSAFEQPLPEGLRGVAASGHHSDGSVIAGRYHTYPELAAAGMWTTASDLARLAIGVSEWHAGRTDGVLSPAMTRQMLTPESGSNGLGFAVTPGAFGHGGSNEGFRCDLFMHTGGRSGAAVMANGDGGDDLIAEIRRAIAEVYDWPDRRQEARATVWVSETTLALYVGDYQAEGEFRTMRIFRRGESLSVELGDLGAFELHPESDSRFFIAEHGAVVTFETAEGGFASALERTGGPFQDGRFLQVV